jgi:tetratricopeptide (TPR) repeat protein
VVAKSLAVAVVLVLVSGCATTGGKHPTQTDEWIDQARSEGVFLEAPLRVSPQLRSLVRDKVGYAGTEKARLLKLVRFLADSDGLAFQYQTQSSFTAEKAFHDRRGDCMSYANLLVALARELDVPVRFVRITQLPVTWEAGGRFFESSHMAVAMGRHNAWDQSVVVDFGNTHTSPWRFSLYDDVSDEEAFVLFQNNVAVQRMLAGDMATAERILRFFHHHFPSSPEVPNNLSLVLLNNGHDREALDLLEASVEQFPRFRPLFANAVQAARRVGDEDLAKTLEARGRELLQDEPAWNFNEGMRSYHARAYSTAALRFEKALAADPDNIRLLAWSARAHLAAGNLRRGLEQVERIRSGPPSESRTQLLQDLKGAFPQIDVPPPLTPPVADLTH